MLKTFFTTFSFKKEDYQEQSSYHEYSYEQKHEKFYEEPKQEEKQKSYEEQKQEKQKNYHKEETKSESNYKKQSYTQHEEPKNEHKQVHGKFEQFYSASAYTILGVSADDDYKTIKSAYRKLLREYHPDLNPDNIEFYNEITQHINGAWEKVESWKK